MLSSGRARRVSAMLLVAGVVAAGASGAAPAGAKVVPATVSHGPIGFFPTPARAKALQTSCTTSCSLMTFHTGGVVQHAEREYLIFWAPSGFYMPSSYKTALSQWVTDFAVSDYGPATDFSVAQQYYDLTGPGAAKSFVPYALSNGGIIADTAVYPANGCTDADNGVTLPKCLNDGQIRAEIQRLVTALHLPQDQNTEYALFTPHNVGSCFASNSSSTDCAYSGYCGYHGFFSSPGGQIVYTNMPWSYTTAGCDANNAFSMGYANGSAIDPEVGVYSHELIETMTDVHLNAWFDSSGNEIGDKCAYNYNGTTFGSSTGLANNGLGFFNQVSNGGQYLMQTEFSNRNSNGSTTGCVGKNNDTQPSFTVTPKTASPGVLRTFTATVTDSLGVAYLDWTFGDGTATSRTFSCTGTTSPFSCSNTHTYASAGTKTLSVIVTDKHGNQKRVNTTITIS